MAKPLEFPMIVSLHHTTGGLANYCLRNLWDSRTDLPMSGHARDSRELSSLAGAFKTALQN